VNSSNYAASRLLSEAVSDAPTAAPRRLSIAIMIETVALGGAEMVVLQLAEELRTRGHSVHPVVPGNRDGWLVDALRGSGFTWHTYEGHRGIDFSLLRRMTRMLQRLRVDVVHSHEFVMAVYGTAIARKLGIPHVVTMHGNMNMTRKWRRRAALRWAFKRSRAVVAVSEDTRRHLESSLGLRRGVVQVVPNGIPVRSGDGSRVRRELGIMPSELVFVAVGSLMARKGHAVLLEAMADLGRRSTMPGWRLLIAGQGAERPRLEAIIREHALEKQVHLLGPRNDVPDLLAAADIFVMPSLWEGLPLAILEAMFAGKAIVASRTSGIPEAIDDRVNGLLTPPGDVVALTDALQLLVQNAEYRAELGRAAQQRATARFSIAAVADAYELLYR
jgi:glycosyltransferase involved in cell wall biosynthesis